MGERAPRSRSRAAFGGLEGVEWPLCHAADVAFAPWVGVPCHRAGAGWSASSVPGSADGSCTPRGSVVGGLASGGSGSAAAPCLQPAWPHSGAPCPGPSSLAASRLSSARGCCGTCVMGPGASVSPPGGRRWGVAGTQGCGLRLMLVPQTPYLSLQSHRTKPPDPWEGLHGSLCSGGSGGDGWCSVAPLHPENTPVALMQCRGAGLWVLQRRWAGGCLAGGGSLGSSPSFWGCGGAQSHRPSPRRREP